MKRIQTSALLLLVALLLVGPACWAAAPQSRAEVLLGELSRSIRARGLYAASFRVEIGGQHFDGRYIVSGEAYELRMGHVTVMGDATTRYEIDSERREVTVIATDAASRNLLDNPVRAFDFLDADYAAELLTEDDSRAEIRLTPRVQGALSGRITLTLKKEGGTLRPLSLLYDFDGEQLLVRILAIESSDASLNPFSAADYPGYEVIDFR